MEVVLYSLQFSLQEYINFEMFINNSMSCARWSFLSRNVNDFILKQNPLCLWFVFLFKHIYSAPTIGTYNNRRRIHLIWFCYFIERKKCLISKKYNFTNSKLNLLQTSRIHRYGFQSKAKQKVSMVIFDNPWKFIQFNVHQLLNIILLTIYKITDFRIIPAFKFQHTKCFINNLKNL